MRTARSLTVSRSIRMGEGVSAQQDRTPRQTSPLWAEGMTHACENITSPQLLLRVVMNVSLKLQVIVSFTLFWRQNYVVITGLPVIHHKCKPSQQQWLIFSSTRKVYGNFPLANRESFKMAV